MVILPEHYSNKACFGFGWVVLWPIITFEQSTEVNHVLITIEQLVPLA